LGLPDFGAYVGAANLETAARLRDRFEEDHAVAEKLRDGNAVLVGFSDALPGQHVGVYKARSARELALAPFVWFAIAAGTALVGQHFYFRYWDMELRDYRAESDRTYLTMAERMAATVQEVAKTDPQAAARIAEANTEALRIAAEAKRAPDTWIDKLLGTGERGLSALLNSPILWIGVALYFSQRGRS
jgi:hypothetical protein